VVEGIGAEVTEFEVGDEVFGIKGGANAEYVCVRESAVLARKPAGLTFEEAGAIADGALLSLTCLKPVEHAGKRILVYGASGSMGTAGVQLAKHYGAHVTAVSSERGMEVVRSLGADVVIDHEREDFTRNGETYDVIYDAVGKHSFRRCRHSLKPGGTYITADLGFMWHAPLLALVTRWIGDRKVTVAIGSYTKADLLLLKQLIEAGEYRPVIDRVYPLEDVVEATRYVETRQKVGNVGLAVDRASRQKTGSVVSTVGGGQ
jgi:NADPH:quinone reductase-like Zn-dependent oxidoreductase